MRVALKIGRDQLLFRVLEHVLHRAFRGSTQRRIYGLHSYRLFRHDGEVDDTHIRRGNADGVAIELPFQLRNHQVQRLGRASRGRDHGKSRRPRATQILVRQVEKLLVIRVGVNRRHRAADDPERVVDYFGNGREAVRGARGI